MLLRGVSALDMTYGLVLQPHLLWLAVRLVVELITGGAARWALPGLLTAPAGIGF